MAPSADPHTNYLTGLAELVPNSNPLQLQFGIHNVSLINLAQVLSSALRGRLIGVSPSGPVRGTKNLES